MQNTFRREPPRNRHKPPTPMDPEHRQAMCGQSIASLWPPSTRPKESGRHIGCRNWMLIDVPILPAKWTFAFYVEGCSKCKSKFPWQPVRPCQCLPATPVMMFVWPSNSHRKIPLQAKLVECALLESGALPRRSAKTGSRCFCQHPASKKLPQRAKWTTIVYPTRRPARRPTAAPEIENNTRIHWPDSRAGRCCPAPVGRWFAGRLRLPKKFPDSTLNRHAVPC